MKKEKKDIEEGKSFKREIILILVTAFATALFGQMPSFIMKIYSLPESVSAIQEDVSELSQKVSEINDSVVELQTIHKMYSGEIAKNPNTTAEDAIVLSINGQLANLVIKESYEEEDTVYLASPTWSANDVIAVGTDGTEYTASELQDKAVIFAYNENGQEVFFQGEINGNNHWDGECLINVYSGEKLIIATKAVYDDGIRCSYEQVFADGDNWVFAERIDKDTENVGDTWRYIKAEDYVQQISFDSPDSNYMIDPQLFIESIVTIQLSHYRGRTVNGLYNDDSGEAYCISFFDDGTVRTIYKGCFVDGEYEDKRPNANSWYISGSRGDQEGADPVGYMYYKGRFSEGHPLGQAYRSDNEEVEVNISEQFANEIIEEEPFKNEIKWATDLFL